MPVAFALATCWWETWFRMLGLRREPAPPTPAGALISQHRDGTRIALYPASLLDGVR